MEKIKYLPRVDFHVHYDDETAIRIIECARENGVISIGLIKRAEISDHMKEYIDYAENLGVKVLPGVEYFARLNEKNVELIALGFDYSHHAVRSIFGVEERKDFNQRIAQKQKLLFEDQGFSFEGLEGEDEEHLANLLDGRITEKAILYCRLASGNPFNRQIMEELKKEHGLLWEEILEAKKRKIGYSTDPSKTEAKFLWDLFFAPGKPCFLPIQQTASQIIDSVHNANGVVLYSPEGKFNEADWKTLISLGIDGIMAWHGGPLELGREQIEEIRKSHLLVLGGSDYDPNIEEWKVGFGNGLMYISRRRNKELIDRLKG